jgi:hypothetical protein
MPAEQESMMRIDRGVSGNFLAAAALALMFALPQPATAQAKKDAAAPAGASGVMGTAQARSTASARRSSA